VCSRSTARRSRRRRWYARCLLSCRDENVDVGADTGTPVDDKDYQIPFKFSGKLEKLTLTIERPKLTPEDEKKLMQAQRNNKTGE